MYIQSVHTNICVTASVRYCTSVQNYHNTYVLYHSHNRKQSNLYSVVVYVVLVQ